MQWKWDNGDDERIRAALLTATQFIEVQLTLSRRGPEWEITRRPLGGLRRISMKQLGIADRAETFHVECHFVGDEGPLTFKEPTSTEGSSAYLTGGYRQAFHGFFSKLARRV